MRQTHHRRHRTVPRALVWTERSYTLREVVEVKATALGSHQRFVGAPILVARFGVHSSELVGRLANRRGAVNRRRLETLATSIEYSIAALRRATGHVPPLSLAGAAGRLAWHLDLRPEIGP